MAIEVDPQILLKIARIILVSVTGANCRKAAQQQENSKLSCTPNEITVQASRPRQILFELPNILQVFPSAQVCEYNTMGLHLKTGHLVQIC